MKVYTTEEIQKKIDSKQKAQLIEEIAKDRAFNGDYGMMANLLEFEIQNLSDLLAEVKRGYPVLIQNGDETEYHFGRNAYRMKETYQQFIKNQEQQIIEEEERYQKSMELWKAQNEQMATESND